MNTSQGSVKIDDDTKAIMVRMVSMLLSRKPSDPVPHIYSFLVEAKKGIPVKEIEPITENELNELKNLIKKLDYYKDILGDKDGGGAVTTEEDESDDEAEEIQPKKKNIKKQRQGVSAEVYGEYNKKENFVPKVIAKTEAQKQSISDRLKQAFMFSALDDEEFKTVVDAIEEV